MDTLSSSTFSSEKSEHSNISSFQTHPEMIATNTKPVYANDLNLSCGVIFYGGQMYYMDSQDQQRIINSKKSFVFTTNMDTYPSYLYNYRRINYRDFIYEFNPENIEYYFKNGNKNDLRRCNVELHHWYHKIIIQQYPEAKYIVGHFSSNGTQTMKNPMWEIVENDKTYLLMYCETDTICKLCKESYQKILDYEQKYSKKLTFYKLQNGYIICSNDLYVHQIIMNCYGNGQGTKHISVDHIDQNPLNNTLENLRLATRQEQEQNTKGIKEGTKRARKTSARELPDGITQDMLRKYVVYYFEWLDKEQIKSREFFKIEKNSKLDKPWIGSKSNKISLLEKLQQANQVADNLENGITPTKEESELPKYVSIVNARDKPHLVFDKKDEDKRLNVKMILPDEYNLQEQLEELNKRVNIKYGFRPLKI